MKHGGTKRGGFLKCGGTKRGGFLKCSWALWHQVVPDWFLNGAAGGAGGFQSDGKDVTLVNRPPGHRWWLRLAAARLQTSLLRLELKWSM